MSDQQTDESRQSYTGMKFSRKPAMRVLLADRWAGRIITASGIGGILAVSLVGLFLLWVALPLLLPTHVERQAVLPAPSAGTSEAHVLAQALDGYGSMAWSLMSDGRVVVQEMAAGRILEEVSVVGQAPLTSNSSAGNTGVALGFTDGTVVLADFAFKLEFLTEADVPDEIKALAPGQSRPWRQGVIARTPEGQLRRQRFALEAQEPVAISDTAVVKVDVTSTGSGYVLAAVDASGTFLYRKLKVRTNMLTGQKHLSSKGSSAQLGEFGLKDPGALAGLKLNDTGREIVLVSRSGRAILLVEYDGEMLLQGTSSLLEGEAVGEARVTAVGYLAGNVSLAVGDSKGRIAIWFPVAGTDGKPSRLVRAHVLEPGPAAVTALAGSGRSRMLAAGFADGTVKVYNVTAERVLGVTDSGGGSVADLAVAPREDRILVGGETAVALLALEAPYGEVSLHTLLGKVWYEGYAGPTYVWQSSSASDSFEPKMSLVPLISGTLKATFYSLLFGLPLAILAALYTSEFLPREQRGRIKPVIEIMASLPSVVLGFLAALVIAPLVEQVAVQVIAVLVLTPACVLLSAHLWQLLPRETAARLEQWRPVAVLLSMALGCAVSWQLGPIFERTLFGGDLKSWLDGQIGSGTPGWVVLLLPLAGMAVGWLNLVYGDGLIRGVGSAWTHRSVALLDLGRFLVSALATVALALFVGWLLDSVGWDPRGSVLGTYVQRNALVVGIAMGFAIIPLIYSISEDALVSVPDHLRAASMGAGATPWQTAVRVVIPPAMSGLFSAAMIGIGRAVGETMIVLMAAGNTPIMDLNIFNGFRTLSANLAVELPEAVKDSTHYRVLFLAALTLFAMTFVLNTAAEGVRLHFRSKTKRL